MEILPTDEIVQLQQDLAQSLANAEQRIAQEQDALQDAAIIKPFDVQSQLSDSLGQFNRKKTLVPLAQEFGIENADKLKKSDLISQLTSQDNLRQLQPRVNELTRAQAQQQLARQERNSAIARTAGNVARGSVGAVQSVASSDQVQAVLGGAGLAVKGLTAVAKTGYSLASGLESLALDMIPLGRTIKGVTKQLVIPAAGFAAATHLLPGGAIAAEGLSHLVGGAITPLTQAAGGAASASNLIAQAIPQTATLFGHTVPNLLAPAAAPITSAVTGAIQSLSASVGEMAVQAGTVLLGGKLIQGTVGKAGEAALKSALPQESTRRALPSASVKHCLKPPLILNPRERLLLYLLFKRNQPPLVLRLLLKLNLHLHFSNSRSLSYSLPPAS
ncbi:MAG: hypothetical protein KME13_24625 [Myxacorys californica WJT36-NPBG1]|nr:hypothetical protein [Myxacorys californica WJT36-NPBG1]